MLRKKTIFLIFLMLCALIGCKQNGKNGSLSPEEEAQLKEKSVAARQFTEGDINLLEANDTVYWYDGTTCLINYLDENDMSWHVLCGKPNCSHTVEKAVNSSLHTSDCDAFIERMYYTPLGFYDGRIYYVEGVPTLADRWISSVKADGTDHRRETEVEFYQGAATQCYFHYGRLYVLNSFYDKKSVVSIYTLNDMKRTNITLDGEAEVFLPRGDFIYYTEFDVEDRSNIVEKRISLDGTVTDFKLDNACSSQLALSIGVYHADDAVYGFYPEKGLYKIDYETGEETVLWSGMSDYSASAFYLYSDGQYIYLRASGEDMYFQGDQKTLLVFDMDGNLIREMEIVNIEEAKEDLKEKINSTADKDLKAQYQNYYRHITGDGQASGYDAFYGSIKGYIFSGNYAMPNQYIKISDLASEETTPEWTDTIFSY